MSENEAYKTVMETLTKKPLIEETNKSVIPTTSFDYKYNEADFIRMLQLHVNKTYGAHYSGTIQPVEFIMSNSSTLDYLKGNAVKYLYRYGKKNGSDVNDLYKACHFIMMMAKYTDKT